MLSIFSFISVQKEYFLQCGTITSNFAVFLSLLWWWWHVSCRSLWSCFCSVDTGDGFAASGSGWDSMSIRHAFIRKVKQTCDTNHAGLSPVCLSCTIITCESQSKERNNLLSACVFQVYLILASQLIVTTAIVAVFTFVWVHRMCFVCMFVSVCVCVCRTVNSASVSHSQPVRLFVQRNKAVYWTS